MPNPKVGTVTDDVAKAVGEAKAGKVEYRTDKQAIVHLSIGKTSFEEAALLENYAAVIEEIIRAKPAAAKGRYILSATLTSTMGPGVRVDTAKTRAVEIMAGAGAGAADATAPARTRRPPRRNPPPAEELLRRLMEPAAAEEPAPARGARLATLPLRMPAKDRRRGRLPRPQKTGAGLNEQGTEDSRSRGAHQRAQGRRRDLRDRLSRHQRAPGRRAALGPARRRRALPRGQEPPHAARRRRGRAPPRSRTT